MDSVQWPPELDSIFSVIVRNKLFNWNVISRSMRKFVKVSDLFPSYIDSQDFFSPAHCRSHYSLMDHKKMHRKHVHSIQKRIIQISAEPAISRSDGSNVVVCNETTGTSTVQSLPESTCKSTIVDLPVETSSRKNNNDLVLSDSATTKYVLESSHETNPKSSDDIHRFRNSVQENVGEAEGIDDFSSEALLEMFKQRSRAHRERVRRNIAESFRIIDGIIPSTPDMDDVDGNASDEARAVHGMGASLSEEEGRKSKVTEKVSSDDQESKLQHLPVGLYYQITIHDYLILPSYASLKNHLNRYRHHY